MLMVLLRLIHIVLGVLWVGSVFAMTIVLAPALKQLGLPLDPVMKALAHRKFPQMMMAFGGLNILAGITMFYLLSHGNEASFFASHFGQALSFGGLCAIVALVIGGAVQRPAMEKAGRIRAEIGNSPNDPRMAEVAALQKRVITAGQVVFALLLLAVCAMATARYL